jgi:hypothetical protein
MALAMCLYLSSCEQIIEIIKPTPPPSNVECLVTGLQGHDFVYEGNQVTSVPDYGWGNGPFDFSMKIYYNEKGMPINTFYMAGRTPISKNFVYDATGRLKSVLEVTNIQGQGPRHYFTYRDNTTEIATYEHAYGENGLDSVMIAFKSFYSIDGNVVKVSELKDGKVTTTEYEYSDIENKNYKLFNSLYFIFTDHPMTSKKLASKMIKDGVTTEYPLTLNKYGYSTAYDYECKEQ